jgi:hypothetical protein
MDIDTLLSRDSRTYRFHGVRADILSSLIQQSEDGKIILWGRNPEIDAEDFDEEDAEHYLQGAGELSCTKWADVEMSCQEFCNEGGIVLVLESIVKDAQENRHPTDRREWLIDASQWQVIGGLSPSFDEDGELLELEASSLEEILALC